MTHKDASGESFGKESVKTISCPRESKSTTDPVDTAGKPLKPCCACPETRKARDECVLMKGAENCQEYIDAHRQCLLSYGFIV